jgi:uncharacterized protein (DUF58 family)
MRTMNQSERVKIARARSSLIILVILQQAMNIAAFLFCLWKYRTDGRQLFLVLLAVIVLTTAYSFYSTTRKFISRIRLYKEDLSAGTVSEETITVTGIDRRRGLVVAGTQEYPASKDVMASLTAGARVRIIRAAKSGAILDAATE